MVANPGWTVELQETLVCKELIKDTSINIVILESSYCA